LIFDFHENFFLSIIFYSIDGTKIADFYLVSKTILDF